MTLPKRRWMPEARLPTREVAVALFTFHLASAAQAPAAQDKACFGFEEEWATCTGQPTCAGCVPKDCSFSAWNEWSYFGGCTQLCMRHRTFVQDNNECGHACLGTLKETKACDTVALGMPSDCVTDVVNCKTGAWQAWFPVTCTDPLGQQSRTRSIEKYPSGDKSGKCTGALTETKPCGLKALPADCRVGLWATWSACDAQCGGGYSTRQRGITAEAAHGGTCPHQDLKEMKACNKQECVANLDCKMTTWTEWHAFRHDQWSRNRQIQRAAQSGGARCSGPLLEFKAAPPPVVENCSYQPWQPWGVCSKPCGMGQQSRTRQMNPWKGNGQCPEATVTQVQGCNEQMCGNKCNYAEWSPWSNCSTQCGDGTQTHTRYVIVKGYDCNGALTEAKPCKARGPGCVLEQNQQCAWSAWSAWTHCSASCGGGASERTRSVVQPPGDNAPPCSPLSMAETKQCNAQTCTPCVNGTWQAWSAWTACSGTCDSGIQKRARVVATEANWCGVPATGNEAEYRDCSALPPCVPSSDCVLGSWASWAACLPSCFGVQERSRSIVKYATGVGKPCHGDSLKEVRPCSPGLLPDGKYEAVPDRCFPSRHKDCMLSMWSGWSACTAACSGTRQRTRRIDALPMRGAACVDKALAEVEGCNTTACHPAQCTDCWWSAWSEWGSCGQCKGQRSRSRHVAQLPTYCGKQCTKKVSEETQNCTGVCEAVKQCVWEEWSITASCPMPSQTNCGAQTYRRTRSMKLVDAILPGMIPSGPKGGKDISCTGFESRTDRCAHVVGCVENCTATNCVFGTWGAWSAPLCTGVCERNRNIVVAAKCGGAECQGATTEAKPCHDPSCDVATDCILSNWSFWTNCGSDPTEQKTKSRTIIQYPKYGGKLCEGPLTVTAGCWEQAPVDCEWAQWSVWGNCSKTCDSGEKSRHRSFVRDVEFQGIPCTGQSKEVTTCNPQACAAFAGSANCSWGPWTAWVCESKYSKMKSRTRTHKWPAAAHLQLAACAGDEEQMQPCDENYTLPQWSGWSLCTQTCGRGQTHRTRAEVILPAHGVPDNFPAAHQPHNAPLKEVMACNEMSCDPAEHEDCHFSPWEAWTPCSVTCGGGQSQRIRTNMTLRHKYGKGCAEHLTETRLCLAPQACKAPVDCQWSAWANWSTCNSHCGGGETTRVRSIAVAPQNGGQACAPLSKEESKPCNTQSCTVKVCTDGVWAPWSAWTACSLTCNPGDGHVGLTSRTRDIQTYPSECGAPLEGPTKQFKSCNNAMCPSGDCVFAPWMAWSGCGTACDGYQRRHRTIKTHGFGPQGKMCEGSTEETIGCKPCTAVVPVNCEFSEWVTSGGVAGYGGCSAQCGGGRKILKRHIKVQAQNGGTPCQGSLEKTIACNEKICPAQLPIDCVWETWSPWGACDKCGPTGQKARTRGISVEPKHGGNNCTQEASEELTKCDQPCGETYCTWGDWQAFGACSATCGHAQKSRRRYLWSSNVSHPIPPTEEHILNSSVSLKYAELQLHLDGLQSSRLRDLTAAFAFGGIAFAVGLSVVRVASFARARRSYRYSRMLGASETDSLSVMSLGESRTLAQWTPRGSRDMRPTDSSAPYVTPIAADEPLD
jgi:hypothetical protein